ncbi:melatonin receptor type 1B-B-like isoform X4 [Acanthochromis polyacanthus]|uniref:melatonin receptor type 1B-B-like isoform X4 n=1 Tax=Acanthochromis polyacanthus TaxID=80966 RepID=UPI002234044B|nr:melatonin receptor type 1B-B-like isoform X4 [Acanthochromis polyacanthus]
MTNVFTVKILSAAGNVFVVSLAFADLVVAFYPYPLVLYAIFHDGWSLGETNCKVCGGGGWQVWLVSNQLIGCSIDSCLLATINPGWKTSCPGIRASQGLRASPRNRCG